MVNNFKMNILNGVFFPNYGTKLFTDYYKNYFTYCPLKGNRVL